METVSILVVDDEPGIAALCKRVLSRAGYDVVALTDPRAAIEHLQRHHLDLLVVDIRMPEVDGFDVIARAQMVQPDIAVLVMTGFGTVETAIQALRQGVHGLLLKPFERSDELLASVRQVLIDNQRKRETARMQALRPLFNVTEKLFSETDRDRLLDLIVTAIRDHLHCSNVAYYQVENGSVTTVAQRGRIFQVEDENSAAQIILNVDQDGKAIVINATGPGEADLQALLSSLGLGSAILMPVARASLHSVLFAARDASGSPFRGADLELFFVLARQAVVAMENARLYEELRSYVRQVEESQQALLRVEKMAAAGRLTASIAHEINNPLQSVQNCLHLAGHEGIEPERRREYLELAKKELDRLSKTVQRMLEFYRPGAIRYEQVDLLDLLNHVLSLTAVQLRSKKVVAKTDLPDSLPDIFAVSSQIQQIFFNLILNALDAMPDGGEMMITVRAMPDGVEISFEDSGPGIPQERRENIFEPFFSTKEGGTGLGLTVSYNIAIAHGGTLDLVEGRGSGACFRLFLPMGD